MKNTIMGFCLFTIVSCVMYFILAFYMVNIDFALWSQEVRAVYCICLTLYFSVILFVVLLNNIHES